MDIQFFVSLGGLEISCSKLHLNIIFTSSSCVRVIPLWISISYVFYVQIQTHAYVIQAFILCHQYSYCLSDIVCSPQNQIQHFHVLPSQQLIFGFHAGGFHQLYY